MPGAPFQPTLKDRSTDRLDLTYVKRGDEGGRTVLADITIVNPISAHTVAILSRVLKILSRVMLLPMLDVKNMPSMISPLLPISTTRILYHCPSLYMVVSAKKLVHSLFWRILLIKQWNSANWKMMWRLRSPVIDNAIAVVLASNSFFYGMM